MALAYRVVGSGPRLVMAHGFTQNGACWGRFADLLAQSYELVLLDLPGHGSSHHDDADLRQAAELLAEVGGEAYYLGYSLGGRIALHAGLAKPGLVKGLVLVGTTAGIPAQSDREDRRVADQALARRLETNGLTAFLDQWLAMAMFAGLGAEATCRAERENNRAAGLAASLGHCGTGTQEPLWDQLSELKMPVLAVAGSGDTKFAPLAAKLVEHTGDNASLALIEGGHAVHLESPDQVAESVGKAIDAWSMV